jgi:hypothetical protein
MPGVSIRLWPLFLLTLLACGAGSAIGNLLGLAGVSLYVGFGVQAETEGILLGGSAGLLAAAGWCSLLLRGVVRQFNSGSRFTPRLYASGVLWAGLLGLGAGMIVLAGLAVIGGRWRWEALLPAMGVGVAAGAALGAVLGLPAWAATNLSVPRGQPHGRG